jgi:hypothetical protein
LSFVIAIVKQPMNRLLRIIHNTFLPKTQNRAFAIYGIGIPIVAFSYDCAGSYERIETYEDGNTHVKVTIKPIDIPPQTISVPQCIGALSIVNFGYMLFATGTPLVVVGASSAFIYVFDELIGFLCGAYYIAKIKKD